MSELRGNFFDVWDTYQKVVSDDYMFHREIGAEQNKLLHAQFDGRSFSILDLGVWRCSNLVDLSEAALALATENLKALSGPVDLAKEHILAALAENARYDGRRLTVAGRCRARGRRSTGRLSSALLCVAARQIHVSQ